MRKLVLKMSVSLDGFVCGPNGEVDWIFNSLDPTVSAWLVDTLWQAGAHVMGSQTFTDMAAYWPSSTEPLAAPMNEIPKIVFSRTGLVSNGRMELSQAVNDARRMRPASGPRAWSTHTWDEPTVVTGDLSAEIARLKQQPGKDLLAHGGARFAQSLARLGLIDEYRLLTHPRPLWARDTALFSDLTGRIELQRVSSTPFAGGALALVYRPARG